MAIFEGKSPTERNKIIAAIVLGVLAIVSLTYTFGGSFFRSKTSITVDADASPTTTPTPGDSNNAVSQITVPDEDAIYQELAVIPLLFNPNSDLGAIGGRNIFAFYEPPGATPTPSITPTQPKPPTPFPPTPPPTPYPIYVSFISPQNVYAGSKSFRLEVNGDKFTPESKIVFNGTPLQTTFVNEQRLYADIAAGLIQNSASFVVYVDTFDGKNFSNQVSFNIQAPPAPQVEYIGMIARQHNNNDTAYFQKGANDDPIGRRLGDEVDRRFRLISISEREVVLEDKQLGFRHRLAMKRPDGQSSSPSRGPGGVISDPVSRPTRRDTVNTDCVPGIPCDIPRAPVQPRPNNPNSPTKGDDNEP